MFNIVQISQFFPLLVALLFAFLINGLGKSKLIQYKLLFWFLLMVSILSVISGLNRFWATIGWVVFFEPLYYLLLLSISPFLYWYFTSLISKSEKIQWKVIKHFYLPMIVTGVFLVIYFITPTENRVCFIEYKTIPENVSGFVKHIVGNSYRTLLVLYYVQFFFYVYKMLRVYQGYKRQHQQEKKLQYWLKLFIIGYIVYELFDSFFKLVNTSFDSLLIYDMITLGYTIYLGYFGLKQYDLSEGYFGQKTLQKIKDSTSRHNISEGFKKGLFQDLIYELEEKEAFLNSKITIQILAEDLKTNKSYLSQVIHEYCGKNFNTLINEYRIEKAKELLSQKDAQNYTLEAIGQFSGFHSKPTFFTTFKKFTGYTPAEYQKMNLS